MLGTPFSTEHLRWLLLSSASGQVFIELLEKIEFPEKQLFFIFLYQQNSTFFVIFCFFNYISLYSKNFHKHLRWRGLQQNQCDVHFPCQYEPSSFESAIYIFNLPLCRTLRVVPNNLYITSIFLHAVRIKRVGRTTNYATCYVTASL